MVLFKTAHSLTSTILGPARYEFVGTFHCCFSLQQLLRILRIAEAASVPN